MLRTFFVTTAAALALAACGTQPDNSPTNETGLGNGATTTAIEDTAAQGVGAATAPLANSVEAFVANAAISDMFEIEAGKIAVTKATSPDVKAFAQMMIKDHTATSAKMKATLASANVQVTPPAVLDDRRQGLIDNLKSASAADFDKVYLDQQTAAHQEALSLMKSYADDGENAPLKALAAETAPKIQMHYDQVRRLDQAGADGSQ
jgi:putative membrane protein